jgi:hypothetical protein
MRLARVARSVFVVVLAGSSFAAPLRAAEPPVHFEHSDGLPPGAIGSAQLLRGGPLPGYFQPVEIRGPQGAMISTAETGAFSDPNPAPLKVGLLIGSVYRLRVTNIPQQEGQEVYPTIEVINRLYPPMGMEFKFSIPIEMTQEELEMALSGRFVTRVVYLEEPEAALPVATKASEQSYFEVAEGENPLDVADTLGRPMAILRLGARVPEAEGADSTFLYGSPPLVRWKAAPPAQDQYPRIEPLARTANGRVRQASATSTRRVPISRGPGSP